MHACIERIEFIKNPTENCRLFGCWCRIKFFIITAGVLVQTSMNKMFAKTKFKILNAF